MENYNQPNAIAPQTPSQIIGVNEEKENLFCDPDSFVPQNLRQFNTQGHYFSTSGVDVYGNPTKFYFTLEERNYLTKNGISAQEFYEKFQSKLGGNFVKDMPKNPNGMRGPEYERPESFVPADMRREHPEKGYTSFIIKDEVGMNKEVFLSAEEIAFVNQNGMDVATYANVYQKEFDYNKGQMEQELSQNAAAAVPAMQQELQMEYRPSSDN